MFYIHNILYFCRKLTATIQLILDLDHSLYVFISAGYLQTNLR